MRKLTVLLLGAALLAGCASAPADSLAPSAAPSTSQSEAQPTQAPAETAAATADQLTILEQLVDYGADTAGGSLKTARAAAVLVKYLSTSGFEADTMSSWRAGLTADKQELLALNWPDILAKAQDICTDPAAQTDLLAAAGVETDFSGMELTAVPDKLAAMDAVLGTAD